MLQPLAHTLVALGTELAWVVHGGDGLDEMTTTGLTKVAEACPGSVRVFDLEPGDFGLETRSNLEALRGGNAEENAQVIRALLCGEIGERIHSAMELVIAKAAAALFVGGVEDDLRKAAERARESIHSGAALEKL